jgi:hypothetical protein
LGQTLLTNFLKRRSGCTILLSARNWQEIYENAAGMGKAGNALGGFTFQFSDGWWKYKQTEDLDVHNTNASWSNGGYIRDYRKGENNMNEEWFGSAPKEKQMLQDITSCIPEVHIIP